MAGGLAAAEDWEVAEGWAVVVAGGVAMTGGLAAGTMVAVAAAGVAGLVAGDSAATG